MKKLSNLHDGMSLTDYELLVTYFFFRLAAFILRRYKVAKESIFLL